jgi:hypothetical protein
MKVKIRIEILHRTNFKHTLNRVINSEFSVIARTIPSPHPPRSVLLALARGRIGRRLGRSFDEMPRLPRQARSPSRPDP